MSAPLKSPKSVLVLEKGWSNFAQLSLAPPVSVENSKAAQGSVSTWTDSCPAHGFAMKLAGETVLLEVSPNTPFKLS